MIKQMPWLLALCVLGACMSGDDDTVLSREELLKPETCKECHPKHYKEWSSSMHAYASKDPVFLAMNKRGQREAKLGDFCVKCHAPMAVLEGATKDGTNLDEVPEHLKGVTCYFCHNVVSVAGDHNNMLKLANDTTMRAGVQHPINPKAHVAAYSELHDRDLLKSSTLCGGCHDIITPDHGMDHGVHLERTFEEYRDTIFANPSSPSPDTCQGCHMDGSDGVIADVKGVPGGRKVHEHLWAAVDVPLTSFPNREAYTAAVEQCALPYSIQFFELQARPLDGFGKFDLNLETLAGHNQPSGAAQDRRMWLEIKAYDRDGALVDQGGVIADDAIETNPDKSTLPMHALNDRIFNAKGEEVHMFWEAAPSKDYPDGYDNSRALPRPKSLVPGSHSLTIPIQLSTPIPGRLEIRVRMRPMGRDVLQDLVDSGDLDAGLLDEMPTFTVYSAVMQWDMDANDPAAFTTTVKTKPDCDSYRCMYDPQAQGCN